MISSNNLIQHLIDTNALHSPNITKAFKNIDRADFVVDPTAYNVYEDYPLQIGFKQTISQPTTVAMMLEMLGAKEGQKILDIGSGSGWTTALLSSIVGTNGSVLGLERVDELVEFGNNNLQKYNLKHAKIIKIEDKLGMPNEKFDRILVSAAAQKFPYELVTQLKVGGKLVIPIKNSIFEVTKKDSGKVEAIEHYGFTFVPLIYNKDS